MVNKNLVVFIEGRDQHVIAFLSIEHVHGTGLRECALGGRGGERNRKHPVWQHQAGREQPYHPSWLPKVSATLSSIFKE